MFRQFAFILLYIFSAGNTLNLLREEGDSYGRFQKLAETKLELLVPQSMA